MKEKLIVLEKANELGEYIFLISDSAPKKYRFTFVSRMQNLMPDIIENLYKANYVNLSYMNDRQYRAGRLEYQEKARLSVDLLCYISQIARKQNCILPKHYEQILLRASEIKRLINGWIRSDMKRWHSRDRIEWLRSPGNNTNNAARSDLQWKPETGLKWS